MAVKNSPDAEIAVRIREAGKRAKAEAEARRKAVKKQTAPVEVGGPAGLEPTRYSDWERQGIASDF
jgi:hypothetical protein